MINGIQTADGKAGSTVRTIFVHLDGFVVSEVTHPAYTTEYRVGWSQPANPWRGPRYVYRTFPTKREAWKFLGSVTKDPRNGVAV